MSKSKLLIDELIRIKAQGNTFQIYNVKMKLMFKGVIVDNITDATPDTPEMLDKIFQVAKEFNVQLPKM